MPTNKRVVIYLRNALSNISKVKGDVIDILPFDRFTGVDVEKEGGIFSLLIVNNLDLALEEELKEGLKRIKLPDIGDPNYNQFVNNGGKSNQTTMGAVPFINYIENT